MIMMTEEDMKREELNRRERELEAENLRLSESHEAAQHYKSECERLKDRVAKLEEENRKIKKEIEDLPWSCAPDEA